MQSDRQSQTDMYSELAVLFGKISSLKKSLIQCDTIRNLSCLS